MPDLLPALANRRARRAFAATPVDAATETLLWRAVSVAPSQGNSQTTRLLVAHDPAVRQALISALFEGNRTWAPAAPLLVAVAALPSQATPVKNSDGSERDLWAFQAGIAAANLMTQATELGLIAHPMANFDEVAARHAFGAPDSVRLLVVVAIGYPGDPSTLPEDLQAREAGPQRRIPLENLVVTDRWSEQHGLSARELRDRSKAT